MKKPEYRVKIENYIIEKYGKILPEDKNGEIYRQFFERLDNDQFDDHMKTMIEKDEVFPYYSPNFSVEKITTDRLLELGDEIGFSFLQQLDMVDITTGMRHITPHSYLIGELPVRRQQEILSKKQSEAVDDNEVDDLTNQPRGNSKGGSFSYPEFQVLFTMGLYHTTEEIFSTKGGDEKAWRAYTRALMNEGGVSIQSVRGQGSKVKSAKTVHAVFKARHLDNNF